MMAGDTTLERRPDEPKPAALASIPPARHVHLDVRADIRSGGEPFAKIMAAVKALQPDQALELRTPFEPLPLYRVLTKQGLAHWAQARAADDWSVWFYREAGAAEAAGTAAGQGPSRRTVTIDVRDLEPPHPMAVVLERLDTLADDEELAVLHSRRPLFLYPLLDDRGFAHETEEHAPGLVRIVIRRRTA